MSFGLSAGALAGIGALAGPVIGGLMGSQGQTSTQQRSMDPRMDSFIYGNNGSGGLLNLVQQQLQKQSQNGGMNALQQGGMEMQRQYLTSPQMRQGADAMHTMGMGLMNGGVAGNGFSRFFPKMGAGMSGGGVPGGIAAPAGGYQNFSFNLNPAMQGAFGGGAAAAPQPQLPAAGPSIDDIIAEIQRRAQSGYVDSNQGRGDGPGNGGY